MKTMTWFMSLLMIAGIASAENPLPELTVMTHDSFSISKHVLAQFEQENRVKIRFIKAGDAGAALNQAILSKGNPLADVFYGVDNTFMSRALKGDIFLPYPSPLLDRVDSALKLDGTFRLLPVDFGDVCLNYDKKWFDSRKIPPPASLEDLVQPEYAKLCVVESPATSSPGLAFLLTTIGHFGEKNHLVYWKNLKQNEVLIVNGWKEAYWGHFTAASRGNRPIVVSYATSPPAEVHFSKTPLTEAPTAAVTAKGTCFRQIEFVGILKGTRQQKMAEKLIDFFLDKTFQEDIPLQMFMFPVNSSARLPDVFVQHAKMAEEPVFLDNDRIESQREKWLEAWADTVLR